MNYFAPFEYPFKDPRWFRKLFIASLLTCTLVGAAPVFGWAIETVRRVRRDEQPALPEWQDWGLFWRLGGQFAFVNAVWLLPLLFAVLLLYLPLAFVSRLPQEAVLLTFAGTLCCVTGFLLVYSVLYVYLVPVMMASLAAGDSSWQAMNPVHLFRISRAYFVEYLMIFLIVGVALFNVAFLLSALTLFLLLAPLLVYVTLVTAHFVGQVRYMGEHESRIS